MHRRYSRTWKCASCVCSVSSSFRATSVPVQQKSEVHLLPETAVNFFQLHESATCCAAWAKTLPLSEPLSLFVKWGNLTRWYLYLSQSQVLSFSGYKGICLSRKNMMCSSSWLKILKNKSENNLNVYPFLPQFLWPLLWMFRVRSYMTICLFNYHYHSVFPFYKTSNCGLGRLSNVVNSTAIRSQIHCCLLQSIMLPALLDHILISEQKRTRVCP